MGPTLESAEIVGEHARSLVAIARLLARAPEPSVWVELCEIVCRTLGTTSASIRVIDERDEHLIMLAQVGLPEALLARDRPLPATELDALLRNYEPVLAETEPEAIAVRMPGAAQFIALGLCALFGAVVRCDEGPVGLLSAASLHQRRAPATPEERLWLQSAADLVGHAVGHQRAMLRLSKSEAQYRRIVSTMRDGVLAWDAQAKVTFCNSKLLELLRLDATSLPGRTLDAVVGPRSLRNVEAAFERSRSGVSERLEVDLLRADGSVLEANVSSAPVQDEHGVFGGALWVVSDLGEQRQLELKVQHAQKLESLGVLAGGIAHDFNNLLVGILGNVGLALEDLAKESPALSLLSDVRDAALRAAELTRQLLAYSGKGRFVIERLDLNRLIEEISHLLGSVISKRAVLRFNLSPNLPPVEGDATQLRQVVMNLITNASDALGDNSGIISINTGVLVADRGYLGATYLDDGLAGGEYVFLEVSDTGSGMSAATQQRIFDPFFTTKFTGRGLGLAATLGILRGHRGAIKVYSELDRGTTFKVLLPATSGSADARVESTSGSPAWRGRGLVLVADDEESVRSIARRVLVKAGFEVVTATDGQEAVALFSERPADFVAAVIDMTMPKLTGEEVLRELRRRRPDLRIVLSSGYNEQSATQHMAGKKHSGFLQKPWLPSELLAALRRALEPT